MTNMIENSGQERLEATAVQLPHIPDRCVRITDFGAIGDGLHSNTEAFARAIEACSAVGGGRVVIPPGIWLTGPIELRSRIELHAEADTLVRFSTDFDEYPLIRTSYEGNDSVRCRSGLDGEDLHDVAITGPIVFDGGGEAWRPAKKSKMSAGEWSRLLAAGGVVDEAAGVWWPSADAMRGSETIARLRREKRTDPDAYRAARDYLRPVLLSLRRCRRVLLDGPTFQNSPAWCLHPWASEHLTVRGVTVRNPWYAQNGDGLDLDSCRYALVENCTFDVGDDAICLKSGKNEAGRALGKPTEHITVKGCTVYHGHGGFVIGSEMSGGVRDVTVSDCTFIGTDIGLRFKSARGRGGIVERIRIERIRMLNIKGEAISFHLFYEGKEGSGEAGKAPAPFTEGTPVFRDVRIEDVRCAGADAALLVNGLPEMPLSGLVVERLRYAGKRGALCINARDLVLRDAHIRPKSGPLVTLDDCENALVEQLAGESGTDDAAVRVAGPRSDGIVCRDVRAATPGDVLALAPEVAVERVSLSR